MGPSLFQWMILRIPKLKSQISDYKKCSAPDPGSSYDPIVTAVVVVVVVIITMIIVITLVVVLLMIYRHKHNGKH